MNTSVKKQATKKVVLNIGKETKKAIEKETSLKIGVEATKKNVEKLVTQKPKKETNQKITFLAEGVTGKMLQSAKIDNNNKAKKLNFSFSYMLKLTLQADETTSEFKSKFKNFNEADLTPKNLLPLLTEREKEYKIKEGKIKTDKQKFGVWLIQNLITRYYKNEITKEINTTL